MLEVVNLELHRGPQRWLHNFSVPDGGALALMGPSGSGKTTLLEALGGFVPIVQGEIRVNAVPVQALPAEQRPVSTLFQEHNLFEHISVRANLRLGFGQGPPTAAQWSVIEAACEHLGIAALLDQGPSELSGGQRQRVALVRAVLR
ncbi:MAG: ATP-binding cassette domain-containing protein, partial [Natronospirillum sp.]